jgi:hypothetical protein
MFKLIRQQKKQFGAYMIDIDMIHITPLWFPSINSGQAIGSPQAFFLLIPSLCYAKLQSAKKIDNVFRKGYTWAKKRAGGEA